MRRLITLLAAIATVAPAGVTLAAVSTTPRSAHALPTFEIATSGRSVKMSAAELGARRTEKGIVLDDDRFARAVQKLQKTFAVPAVPGTYELKPDHRVTLHAGRPGAELDVARMRVMLVRALKGSRSNLRLPMRVVPPPAAPRYAVVVRLRDFALDLYEGPRVQQNFEVGVGALSFPTPPGAYYIRSKAVNPSWRNPGSAWARSMPAYIPPGPRNPLGTRALRLDRGALVIHGTPQPWTVGRRSSHGCIRMRRDDVERLFGIVPEGTPVFIIP